MANFILFPLLLLSALFGCSRADPGEDHASNYVILTDRVSRPCFGAIVSLNQVITTEKCSISPLDLQIKSFGSSGQVRKVDKVFLSLGSSKDGVSLLHMNVPFSKNPNIKPLPFSDAPPKSEDSCYVVNILPDARAKREAAEVPPQVLTTENTSTTSYPSQLDILPNKTIAPDEVDNTTEASNSSAQSKSPVNSFESSALKNETIAPAEEVDNKTEASDNSAQSKSPVNSFGNSALMLHSTAVTIMDDLACHNKLYMEKVRDTGVTYICTEQETCKDEVSVLVCGDKLAGLGNNNCIFQATHTRLMYTICAHQHGDCSFAEDCKAVCYEHSVQPQAAATTAEETPIKTVQVSHRGSYKKFHKKTRTTTEDPDTDFKEDYEGRDDGDEVTTSAAVNITSSGNSHRRTLLPNVVLALLTTASLLT